MSPYSTLFNAELKTIYWIIALYSLVRSSFSPRINSSLLDADASSVSATSEFFEIKILVDRVLLTYN